MDLFPLHPSDTCSFRSISLNNDYKNLGTLADLLKTKYEFRPSARTLNNRVSTWVDQDDSGNYNPFYDELGPTVTFKRKRDKPNRPKIPEQDRPPKKPKVTTWQLGRQIGLISPVTLKLTSDRGRALLRKLSVVPDNWPQPVSDSADESDPFTSSWPASRESFSTSLTSDTSLPYLLRSHSGTAPRAAVTDFSSSLLNHSELTLGHPEARGCKPCLELGEVCPLLSEGSTYPCDHCVEDSIECELVIPPAKKGACEGCQSRRLRCSYRDGGDHSLPCEQCVQLDYKCVAGPKSGRIRTGPSLDQIPNTPRSERAFVSCTSCRKEKRWCSLKDKTRSPPCNYCLKSNSACTFEKLEDKARVREEAQTSKPNVDLHISDQTQTSTQAITRTITTRYAHPITFNYEPPEDDSLPCHFCQHIGYGVLGLGEKTVDVIDYGTGDGYVEIAGGHTGDGREQSRMCVACTMDRLRIHFCKEHKIRPIPGSDPESFDFDAAFKGLDPTCDTAPELTQWCSICSSPAFFHCTAQQETDIYGVPATPGSPDATGCGLLLCESCAAALTGDHKGDLESWIEEAEKFESGDQPRLRADVGFLRGAGELMKQVYSSSIGE
ncbi:hypothetical protein MMC16_007433 [Acarospora aff. strigata]|nr:hypothetical protein [Acarospora aff. strigata]